MKQLELEDFLDYNYLANLKTNDAQTHFAYIKSKADTTKNNYSHTLYISDGMTHNKAVDINTAQFYWETDTSILVPHTTNDDEKKKTQNTQTVLYRYNLNNKTFEYADTLYVSASSIECISDKTWLLTTSLQKEAHTIYEDPANRNDTLAKESDYEHFEEITSISFYNDGGTFSRRNLGQALIYNPLNKTYTRIFDKDMNVSLIRYDKETSRAYFVGKKDTGVKRLYNDTFIYDFNSNTLSTTFENETLAISDYFELNGNQYLLANDMKAMGLNTNDDFYILKDKKATLTLEFGLSTGNSTGSDARLLGGTSRHIIDNKFYFTGTFKDASPLYTFDGALTKIYDGRGSIDTWIHFKDKFVAVGMFDSKLQEIYTLDLENHKHKQDTHFNDDVLKGKYVAKPQYHAFKNGDLDLDGWVLVPQNYSKENKYPAILDIHGGPKTIYNDNFFHEMQVWANKGYIVFFCNPRGSDSYGDDFADIRGKYGTVDYDDIMTFTDYVIEQYSIDTNRMGVTGGSYGGFMTNWIVSHTDRFKAAATQRSISNWISFFGTSDIGYYFGNDQTDADPIADFDKAWNQSPLKYAHNIKTPLLFIHSD